MNKKATILLLAVLLLPCIAQAKGGDGENLINYVEPRIGTAHCRYFHFAPGALPYGMAKPGPSTNGHLGNKDGWEATGYDYRDTSIEGFPCVHEFQVGGITLMATRGGALPVTVPGLPTDTATDHQELLSYASHDKKRHGSTVNVVVPTAIGTVEVRKVGFTELLDLIDLGCRVA